MRESTKMREDSLHSYYHLNCLGVSGLLLYCLLLLHFIVVREQKYSLQSTKRIFKDTNIVKYGDSDMEIQSVCLLMSISEQNWWDGVTMDFRCSLNFKNLELQLYCLV